MSHQDNLIPPTSEGISYGASLIQGGKLVAFPTETVYGLGANALDAQACTSIFQTKGRPMTDPLIVHVAEPSLAESLTSIDGSIKHMFERLAAEFWPGPLTIIVRAAECIPPEVTANTGFVGIRCPNHPLALKFLDACQRPVAAPSANLFGHVSPTLAQHVLDDLGAKGVRVLDGDSLHAQDTCLHGIESTVVKLEKPAIDQTKNQITILRQGAVSQAQLERVAANFSCQDGSEEQRAWCVLAMQRQVRMDAPPLTSATTSSTSTTSTSIPNSIADIDSSASTKVVTQDIPPTECNLEQSTGEVAPGQSLTHYAPYIPCYAVESCISNISTVAGFNIATQSSQSKSSHEITEALAKYEQRTKHISLDELKSVVILDFMGQLEHYSTHCLAYQDLSIGGDSTAAARGLFAALRWAESQPHATQVLMAPIISAPASAVTINDANDKGSIVHGAATVFDTSIVNKDDKQYDLFFGLSDRIFRATSGASVQLVLD